MKALDFPGLAIGGLSVGEPPEVMRRIVGSVEPLLPKDRPRYLMGVGTPEDIVHAVACGIDLFDCVLPTRNARNGQVFTRHGRFSIRNKRFGADPLPIDSACPCHTCRHYSRAYLRHLHQANEIAGASLLTLHNLAFYLDTLRRIRQSIRLGRFGEFQLEILRSLSASPAQAAEGV
jgi:queuine tRNA-ribosyltransferase